MAVPTQDAWKGSSMSINGLVADQSVQTRTAHTVYDRELVNVTAHSVHDYSATGSAD